MADDIDIPEDPPSLGVSIAMIVIGALFLAPFILLALTGGPVFNPMASLSALMTVGWGVFIGAAFVIYGWRRVKKWRALTQQRA